MVAHMNAEALAKTVETGEAWYFSRSRRALWRKGETSGHTQRVVEMRVDCDQDAVWIEVAQVSGACHTGRHSCFYRRCRLGQTGGAVKLEFRDERVFDPKAVYRDTKWAARSRQGFRLHQSARQAVWCGTLGCRRRTVRRCRTVFGWPLLSLAGHCTFSVSVRARGSRRFQRRNAMIGSQLFAAMLLVAIIGVCFPPLPSRHVSVRTIRMLTPSIPLRPVPASFRRDGRRQHGL